jgi:acetyl esterase/lipase
MNRLRHIDVLLAALTLAGAALVFLLSLLAAVPPGLNLFWKLSIPVQETGFLLAPLLLLLALAGLRRPGARRWASLLLLGAVPFLLWPLAAALFILPSLERDFARAFPAPRSASLQRAAPIEWTDFLGGVDTRAAPPARTETYARKDGIDLRLDFYPAARTGEASTAEARAGTGKAPCIVVIHGGGWDTGERGQFREMSAWLAGGGYAVASIDYRLAPRHPFPAPIEDVRDALAWLRARADELGIDPEGFVLLGRSAGGQIALQAAYTLKDPGLRGVIAYYAPADMVFGYSLPGNPLILDSRKVMDQYLNGGCRESDAPCRAASPLEFADRDAPPTLLLHGRPDVLVSFRHTVHLGRKLDSLGVPHAVVDLPWATHGYDYFLRGLGSQISLYFVERFLARVAWPE